MCVFFVSGFWIFPWKVLLEVQELQNRLRLQQYGKKRMHIRCCMQCLVDNFNRVFRWHQPKDNGIGFLPAAYVQTKQNLLFVKFFLQQSGPHIRNSECRARFHIFIFSFLFFFSPETWAIPSRIFTPRGHLSTFIYLLTFKWQWQHTIFFQSCTVILLELYLLTF